MAEELNPKRVALSLAIVAGAFYVVCAILVAIAPELMLNLFNNIFHGIDVMQIAKTSMSAGAVIIGFVEVIIYSLIAGWLFAVVYNTLKYKLK